MAGVFSFKPTIICARPKESSINSQVLQMTSLSISTHFDLVTIPRFVVYVNVMSLIPLTFFRRFQFLGNFFSLGCLYPMPVEDH